jgi:tetratricopeptide (TPR) repeat protein
MKKIFFLFYLLLALRFLGNAQTYVQIKSLDTKELDSIVAKISRPANAELRYWFNATDIEEKKYESIAKRLQELDKYEQAVRKNPEDMESYTKMHDLYLLKNPQDTATYYAAQRKIIEKYTERYNKNIDKGQNAYFIAQRYTFLKDYVKAFDWAIEAKKILPDSAKVYAQLSYLNLTLGDYEKARKFSQEAIAKDESNYEYYVNHLTADLFISMASYMQNNGDTSKIISIDLSYILKAQKKFPKKQAFQTLYQSGLLMQEFYRVMATAFSSADELKDKKQILTRLRSQSKAIKEIQQYFEDKEKKYIGGQSFLQMSLSIAYLLGGEVEKSKVHAAKAIEENPEKMQLYTNLAFVYIMQEDYAKAEEVMKAKILKAEEATDYAILAEIYHKLKQAAQSDAILQQGLKRFYNHPTLLFFQALNEYDKQQYEKSLTEVTNSLKADNTNLDAILLYGILSLRKDDVSAALDSLYFAMKKGNETAATLFNAYFKPKE